MMFVFDTKKIIIVSVLMLLGSHATYGDVELIYNKPINSIESVLQADMKESMVLQSTLRFIKERFKLSKQLKIIFGETPNRALSKGPYYYKNTISIPYAYVYYMRKFLSKRRHIHKYQDIDKLIFESMSHALLHEFGHAMIDQYRLPVAGLEEDTVDNFANYLSLSFFPNGQSMLESSAMIFYLKSKTGKQFQQEQFWSEHRLPIQRYYSLLCHSYGYASQVSKNTDRVAGFSKERMSKCVVEYKRLSRAWSAMLKPYFKP